MLLSGSAELLSLGAVLPFLVVLSDPQELWNHPLVNNLAIGRGYTSPNDIVFFATLAFIVAAVLAAIIRLTNLWLNGRLAAAVGSDLSCEAYRRTLYQPYEVHVTRNSASIIAVTTTQIGYTVAALNSVLQLITSGVVASGLILGLILIDASAAVIAIVLFGITYSILAVTARRELRSNSQKITEGSTQQLKSLQEGLGAIRDVILSGSHQLYLENYKKADYSLRQLGAKNVFLGSFPRYALEAIGMVAIASLGFILVLQRGSDSSVIPRLGALALGAQRLLPALQQIYTGWAAIKGYGAAIQAVLEMLNQPLPPKMSFVEPLLLRESVLLKDVHFRYGPEQSNVLQGLDLEICCGERIGIIGSTGSGKSTAVDLLMGLLSPSRGNVYVDGIDLHNPKYPERLLAWRASIAHVPQSIYLADGSIAENIALGIPRQNIDMVRVRNAAAQAQIASFIEASPLGYESFVGERGIRLSGGQRQRIGIARALYKQASVLILDEATSALDSETEEAVMSAVEGLSKALTIVMIAHRLSTVRRCDKVVHLSGGVLVASGPPSLLLRNKL